VGEGVGVGTGVGEGVGVETTTDTGTDPVWLSVIVSVQLPFATAVTVVEAEGPFKLPEPELAIPEHALPLIVKIPL
jgi:hypothetical protein